MNSKFPGWISVAIAAVCLAAGVSLVLVHPVLPQFVVLPAFLGVVLLSVRRPWLGLLALPALAPILNFAPWTGGLIFDEFDLLVLAVLAGGYRGSRLRDARRLAWPAIIAVYLVGRGMLDGSIQDINAFADTLRVGKSLLWTTLLLPLLLCAFDTLSRQKMLERFFWASLLGSVWVVLAVLWERAFYPGLLDIHTPYRTVGLFWEMHHGGAALDIYLVLIAPLLAWAWRRALPAACRLLLGAFIVAFVYACLTTFSRGAVFAATGAVVLQGMLYSHLVYRRHASLAATINTIKPASLLVIALAGIEAFMVFGTDSFMNSRMQQTGDDFGGRLAHWERALGALNSPADWLFGIGPGKFPSPRLQRELGVPLPGEFGLISFADGTRGARLAGPDRQLKGSLPGRFFALSQRIDSVSGAAFRFSIKARSVKDDQKAGQASQALVRVCASHLLYPARCGTRIVSLMGDGWQERQVWFSGRVFQAESWWRAMLNGGHGVFLISVLTPDAVIEIAEMRLATGGPEGRNLLLNPGFDEGRERWFPQSFHYFLPWHIDNLYLEFLVETGATGLIFFLWFVFRVFWRLFQACLAGRAFSIELFSSGAGVLVLGLIVSILDMPRVATLTGLFLVLAMIPGSVKRQ
ncbi:hypothetical protein FACS189475_07100 [Betaproteobacteria bacterium]|nr:hypothetical protein FACS189475_07100 [Betaproteobacteria bacterium]